MNGIQACPLSKNDRLLLVTDGSLFSDGAIREGLAFAKRCSSKVYVISVLETNPEYDTIGSSVFEKEETEMRQHLEAVKTKADEAGLRCETIFHHDSEPYRLEALTPIGRSYDVIVETAGGRGVDLIVMGAYGKTGLKKLRMGSTTEKVIGLAGCAVLVVKA